MSFYDVLAENYSEIFPLDADRVRFITTYVKRGNSCILDVGCATGDLAIELAKKQFNITAIDLNHKMISIAKQKAAEFKLAIDFQTEDMLHIKKLGSEQFSLILCFGNTLSHLNSCNEVESFFLKAYYLLPNGDRLLFQILNYDKILAEKKVNLPIIEIDEIIFTREYKKIEEHRICFQTILQKKNTKRKYSESIMLIPITKKQIETLAYKSGFSIVERFSDYNFSTSDLNEYATIYVITK